MLSGAAFMDQACKIYKRQQDDILLDADSTKTDYLYGENRKVMHGSITTVKVGYHPFVINEYIRELLSGHGCVLVLLIWPMKNEPIMAKVLKRLPDYTADGRMRDIKFRGDAVFFSGD